MPACPRRQACRSLGPPERPPGGAPAGKPAELAPGRPGGREERLHDVFELAVELVHCELEAGAQEHGYMVPARHPIPAVRGELAARARARPAGARSTASVQASTGRAKVSRRFVVRPGILTGSKESLDGSSSAASVCARRSSGNGGRIAVPRMFRGCSVDVPWMIRG